jgi:hypothetical protein
LEIDTEDDDDEEKESPDEESEEEVPVKETKADTAPQLTKIGKKDKAFANEGKPAKNRKK